MPRISHVGTAVPKHVLEQEVAARTIAGCLDMSQNRVLAEVFRRSQVDRRHTVLEPGHLQSVRSLSENMELYREHAVELATQAAKRCLDSAGVAASEIDAVVTSSCTGLLLPSLAVLVGQELGLPPTTRRIPINEAGCAGGASALARAEELVRGRPHARVLIVAVELPSLTLQRADRSSANMMASAIFGDGAAAALVQGERAGSGLTEGDGDDASEDDGLEIVETRTALLDASTAKLGFDLRDGGLHIVLSREVPAIISRDMPTILDDFLSDMGLELEQLDFFVLHPGGRRILDSLETALGLSPSNTAISRSVLKDFGNQSSASVLFVLERTLRETKPAGYGLLAAFGPGITAELALLRARPGSATTQSSPRATGASRAQASPVHLEASQSRLEASQ